MASLGFASAEAIIADACDGDAGGRVAVGTADGACVVRANVPAGGPDAPSHAIHVCHCVHTHNGSVTAPFAVVVPSSHLARQTSVPGRLPPNRSLQPPQRPPLS